ncbi:MAG TPA: hypothetical protein VKW06_05450 [Candidatus Angelobacter sp.]|nr:hypothetical protein [Candidatus Angelobacter sp.]
MTSTRAHRNHRNAIFRLIAGFVLMLPCMATLRAQGSTSPYPPAQTAATRHDHIGQPVPEFMTGDQCLFCHRNVVGPTWEQEPHAWTIRPVGVPPKVGTLPADATHVIGSPQHFRALKQIGYGKFAILANDGKTWQPEVFATRCAGCHTTGVDPVAHTFAGYAFDCFACHGDLQTDHTTKPEVAPLGKKRKDPKEIVAICGQCHLRGGHSHSSGLPYPNNFIAGDDLFTDFKVDLSRDHDPSMNPADRHTYTFTRSVMEKGSTQTCLECHRVHGRPELKHEYCVDCDELPASAKAAGKLRSETCLY